MMRGADFVLIDRQADLAAAAEEIGKAAVVAVDTESDSLYRYRERVCFLQIGVGSHAWLVDTLAVRDLGPLKTVFEGPQTKVLHGADYDLSCLFRDFGIRFRNVFDTMIAAQLLGREQLGLAALVREFFGVELDKSLTRHDWGSRPLEPRHLRYLVEDVVYLTGVLERLSAELATHDLEEEAALEFERLVASTGPKQAFDPEGFRSIRGAHALDRQALSILREVYLLRDRLAARADKPPFKVFGNQQLLEIADTAPSDLEGLRRATGFPEHLVRRFGRPILEAVDAGVRNQGQIAYRIRSKDPRPSDEQLAWVDVLKTWRREASARDGRTTMAILPNHLVYRVAELRPSTLAQLEEIPFFGKRRLARYGEQILLATHGGLTTGA
jgi:ribonuclease D